MQQQLGASESCLNIRIIHGGAASTVLSKGLLLLDGPETKVHGHFLKMWSLPWTEAPPPQPRSLPGWQEVGLLGLDCVCSRLAHACRGHSCPPLWPQPPLTTGGSHCPQTQTCKPTFGGAMGGDSQGGKRGLGPWLAEPLQTLPDDFLSRTVKGTVSKVLISQLEATGAQAEPLSPRSFPNVPRGCAGGCRTCQACGLLWLKGGGRSRKEHLYSSSSLPCSSPALRPLDHGVCSQPEPAQLWGS